MMQSVIHWCAQPFLGPARKNGKPAKGPVPKAAIALAELAQATIGLVVHFELLPMTLAWWRVLASDRLRVMQRTIASAVFVVVHTSKILCGCNS